LIKALLFLPILTTEASPLREAGMESSEEELTRKQKCERLVPMLMLAVVGVLTTSLVVVVFFFFDLQQLYQECTNVYLFNFLLFGSVVLAFIFLGCLALKELPSKKLKTDLLRQRVTSQALAMRVTELEAVHELTSLVNSEMPLSDILDNICRKAMRTLGADQSSFLLYDPDIDKLRCVSVRGLQNDVIKNAPVEVEKSVAGWVIKYGKPLHLDRKSDVTQSGGLVRTHKRISSSLCLPLMVNNKTRGVLNVTLFDPGRKFAESDLNLASIFAENAAIAIDKTGLYERPEKQAKSLNGVINELKSRRQQFLEPETLSALSNLGSATADDFSDTLTAILEKTRLLLREVGGASIQGDIK
jgi:hypothetical protein